MTYAAEFDTVDAMQWHQLLQEFDDASIFQTWPYGAAHWGDRNLSHAVIRKDGAVVGLAQAVLFGIPLVGKILAYVLFGPVCQRRDTGGNIADWNATIAALREEYAIRRRMCLRLRLWVHDVPDEVRAALLSEDGWKEARPVQTTYIVDLSHSETQLRAAMNKKWRANLRKSEHNGLLVTRRNDTNAIRVFVDLHRQMRERKAFSTVFVNVLSRLYSELPDALRPDLFVCWKGEDPVAAAVVSALGNRAFSLNAATGNAALALRAGYFLQWMIIRRLKETGRYRWYDLCVATPPPGVRRSSKAWSARRRPRSF
jgi:hypothetical protein